MNTDIGIERTSIDGLAPLLDRLAEDAARGVAHVDTHLVIPWGGAPA